MKAHTLRVVYVNRGYASPLTLPHGLAAMQTLVGGLIERVADFIHHPATDGKGKHHEIDVYANEEAFLIDPEGEAKEEPITGALILGPYFYVGHDGKGELISLTDAQIAYILGAHG